MKWKISLLITLVAVILTIVILWQRLPATIAGPLDGLPKEDQAPIRRAITGEMRRKAFPSFSWKTFVEAPKSLRRIFSSRIEQVRYLSATTFVVQTKSRYGVDVYFLRKSYGTNSIADWQIMGTTMVMPVGTNPPGSIAGSPYRGPAWFGAYDISSMNSGVGRNTNDPIQQIWDELDGHSHRPSSVASETQFATSLTNHTGITFGR